MKEKTFCKQLSQQAPEVPEIFTMRMEKTLEHIVIQEANMKESTKEVLRTGSRISRRALALAAALMLFLGAIAYAATQWHVFDCFSYLTGKNPVNADSIMQQNLYEGCVDGVAIKVLECGYDGKTLLLVYSLTYPDIDYPLGNPEAAYSLSDEDLALLKKQNVGWWIDQIWFNGKGMDMPSGSACWDHGSTTPGELICVQYWRIDRENIALNDTTEISLPIGRHQDLSEFSLAQHPEKYDADNRLLLPEEGMITFAYNPGNIAEQIVTEHPNQPTVFEDVTIQVSEVVYSPLMTYITFEMVPDAEALAAYKAQNGEGYTDENGNMLWSFTGANVYGDWISEMVLVDRAGNELFPGRYANEGYSETWAEFDYPYIETLPEELYMAAKDAEGHIDLTKTVKVR